MSIEAFQIASGVLAVSSVGLAIVAHGLHKRLTDARIIIEHSHQHVRNLKMTLASTYEREDQLVRQNAELNGIVTKVQNQRLAALSKAAEKRKAAQASKDAEKNAAAAKTFSALQAAPLRPRDEVVANIRSSKAAQAVSSGG